MKAALLQRFTNPREGDFYTRPHRVWRNALGWLFCIIVSAGAPDPTWGQYSSGGYSRPTGGYASGYSAPSRRVPVTSSGGYSRRSYSGGGYTTYSMGDRAMSRSTSSQALGDYQAAQRAPEPYVRRPSSMGS